MFHNAAELTSRGSGPYFYLPKTESHLEARLWHDVFTAAEESLGLPVGTVRATVLIETVTAAVEMEEILFELHEHAAGLNAGRWDYLFSMIKNFRDGGGQFVLPDRSAVTMTAPFMRAYTELLVSTCHRRGAFAIGGMAAFIPSRRDAEANERALAKVREDKEREAADGFDGSWVAHPDLVPVCQEVFDRVLGDRPNQLDRLRDDVHVGAAELLDVASTGGRGDRGRLALQRLRRAAVPRRLAGRARCGRHQRVDGGRRDGRDLPLADLAVDRQRHRARRHRRHRHARPGASHPVRGARSAEERPGVRRGAVRSGPRPLRTGRAGNRLRRLPHAARLRPAAPTEIAVRASRSGSAGPPLPRRACGHARRRATGCGRCARRTDRRGRPRSTRISWRTARSSWPTTRCCCPAWSTRTCTSTSPGAPSGKASRRPRGRPRRVA